MPASVQLIRAVELRPKFVKESPSEIAGRHSVGRPEGRSESHRRFQAADRSDPGGSGSGREGFSAGNATAVYRSAGDRQKGAGVVGFRSEEGALALSLSVGKGQ